MLNETESIIVVLQLIIILSVNFSITKLNYFVL